MPRSMRRHRCRDRRRVGRRDARRRSSARRRGRPEAGDGARVRHQRRLGTPIGRMTRQPAENEFCCCLHSPASTRYRAKGAECHCRSQPPEHGPYGRSDKNVTRVMHACVHAGKSHNRGSGSQRQLERRQDVSDGNGERGGGRGVTGGERRRRGHGHPSSLRDTETIPVGATAFASHLHGLVHHQGCRADGARPVSAARRR